MNRSIGVAVLVVGLILIGFGISSAESLTSEISEFFSGSPTDKAIWLLLSGVFMTVLGGVAVASGRGSKS